MSRIEENKLPRAMAGTHGEEEEVVLAEGGDNAQTVEVDGTDRNVLTNERMSRIEEMEQRMSEMLAARAGTEATYCQIKELVKEYEKTLNSAIEISKDNLAYVIVAVKRFLDILENINGDLTMAAQVLYRAIRIGESVQEEAVISGEKFEEAE